jgi:ABC-type sugar transport system permease subunit
MPRGSELVKSAAREETRLAWLLLAPALGSVVAIALFPLAWAVRESFHLHDLRAPWLDQPWIGLANYAEAVGDARLWLALAHTAGFTALSVSLELALGLLLALALHRVVAARGAIRTVALIPWALPTVVAALLWRFLFDGPTDWLADPIRAWIPIVLADLWKTTPFVVLLLLAGLQTIDESLYEAARVDGATDWQQFRHVTLPLLRPALLVALIFRTLDAFRVFDLIYALTGGGPGTATEPVSLSGFTVLLQNLRFGYGSAIAVIVFLLTFGLALLYVRTVGAGLLEEEP